MSCQVHTKHFYGLAALILPLWYESEGRTAWITICLWSWFPNRPTVTMHLIHCESYQEKCTHTNDSEYINVILHRTQEAIGNEQINGINSLQRKIETRPKRPSGNAYAWYDHQGLKEEYRYKKIGLIDRHQPLGQMEDLWERSYSPAAKVITRSSI